MLRETSFYLDFLEGHNFNGFTENEEWNGFACPLFTREQGIQLVGAWRETGQSAEYDENSDSFIFNMADGEQDIFLAKEVDGQKLYPIGASCWIWSESTALVEG